MKHLVAQARIVNAVLRHRRIPDSALAATTASYLKYNSNSLTSSSNGSRRPNWHDLSPSIRGSIERERLIKQVRLAINTTVFYERVLGDLGIDLASLANASIAESVPLTRPEQLRERPDEFLSRSSKPILWASTSGTSGNATRIAFSTYELDLMAAVTVQHIASRRLLRSGDTLLNAISSRAVLPNSTLLSACRALDVLYEPMGLIEPADALDRLGRTVAGAPTALNTYPSYLGALVEEAQRRGMRPKDFRIKRIFVGGEIVTNGLRRRTSEIFGDTDLVESANMTETAPAGGTVCSQRHIHYNPLLAYVEVVAIEDDIVPAPKQTGRLVVTPLMPFRETTMLVRYDTGDLISRINHPVTCEERTLPAFSQILGRRRFVIQNEDGWIFQRQVQEALESVDAVPLPARYRLFSGPDGPRVEVLVRRDGSSVRVDLRDALAAAGLPTLHVGLASDIDDLTRTIPVRSDLRERVSLDRFPT